MGQQKVHQVLDIEILHLKNWNLRRVRHPDLKVSVELMATVELASLRIVAIGSEQVSDSDYSLLNAVVMTISELGCWNSKHLLLSDHY